MNTRRQISDRLIKLFPVKVAKELFNTDVAKIIIEHTDEVINDRCYSNLYYTKQHIYIYHLDKNFDKKTFDTNGFPVEILKTDERDGITTYICRKLVTFNVTTINPYNQVKIKFYQPLIITLNKRHLIIHTTILEKSISSYFENVKVVEATREVNEEELIGEIRAFFEQFYRANYCDINKGIKEIWENDLIDSKQVKFKKNKSTSTEVMDEDFTVKEHYPDVYKQLVKSPLNKTVFKYLKDDGLFIDHFTADPSLGRLSFPLFPKTPNQINNVIQTILAHN
jgi:hypothetical protein